MVFRGYHTLTLTVTLELTDTVVVEETLTVTSRPALTLDFTCMTYSLLYYYLAGVCIIVRP
jgi:hypothetical protein